MDVRVVIICSGELDSIKIDGEEMEGLSVIKHKPIPDWFVPSNDRSGWEGLIEEIRKKLMIIKQISVLNFTEQRKENKYLRAHSVNMDIVQVWMD
jgi:FOG: TPR repeat, SEL1 subfamily